MSRTPEQLYDRGQNNLSARARIAGSVAVRLMTVPGLAALISACGGGSEATPTTPSPAISVEVQTPSPTVAGATQSTETSTPKPTEAITASPTEAPVDQPCLVLPQEYCNQGEVIEREIDGIPVTYIAFNLPEGTLLTSPSNGFVFKRTIEQPFILNGKAATINDPADPLVRSVSFVGDITFDNSDNTEIKQGDVVGTIGNEGVKNFENYNLVISAQKLDEATQQNVSDDEFIIKLSSK